MPNYIKALILVLVATSVVIFIARDPLSSHYSKEEFKQYRNTWLFLTVCLFLSPGIWIFYAIVLITLLNRKYVQDMDRVLVYCFLLFVAPSIEVAIPGPGGINKIFAINIQRILILVVLLPILTKSLKGGLFRNPSDKYVLFYILLIGGLLFRDDNHTNAARLALLLVIDVLIPYFVISRTIKSVTDFNRLLLILMFALALLSAEAVMESIRHWELYNSVGERLIGERVFRFSGERAGILRARAIFLSPIILGYVMVLLLALLFYLKPYFTKKMGFYCLVGLAGMALVVSFSRGVWVGAVLFLIVHALIANGIARSMVYVLSGSLVGFLALNMTAFGQRILDLLPFFGGKARVDTFDYRARLLENGIKVIERNPWLGDHYYLESPEMQAMRQGQGIIDTVNVFLSVAMRNGLIGLFLFVMIFIPSLIIIYRAHKTLPESERRLAEIGRILISFTVAALVIISTVANTDFIPVIYFMVVAMMAAWISIYRDPERNRQQASDLAVRNGDVLNG